MLRNLAVLATLIFSVSGCRGESAADKELPSKFRRLVPLHAPLGRPRSGDWLAHHDEQGQTFRQYVRGNPIRPDAKRRIIYIQPLGEFDAKRTEILEATAEFLEIYFGLEVRTLPAQALTDVPAEARRVHPQWKDKQIMTSYLLYDVLKPRLPPDAVAMIGLTTSDLWPGEGWNFVFGQATLVERVGVWSIYRFGDPNESEGAFRLALLRTIRVASHELGHQFSMQHCVFFECNMCGSNSMAESDRRPLALCPHCLAKLCYATKVDPAKRYEKLIDFCHRHGLEKERAFYERLSEAASK